MIQNQSIPFGGKGIKKIRIPIGMPILDHCDSLSLVKTFIHYCYRSKCARLNKN